MEQLLTEYAQANARKVEWEGLVQLCLDRGITYQELADTEQENIDVLRAGLIALGVDPDTL